MWVWQSQAPAGMSKFTGVDGCEAAAKAVRLCMAAPAAMVASIILRLVSIGRLPFIFLVFDVLLGLGYFFSSILFRRRR
jgi:hypothetical protein